MNSQDSIRALVIEDDADDALTIEKNLTRARGTGPRIEVFLTERLGRGLELVPQKNPDVILLDLNLPDSDGLETFDRAFQAFPLIPIVVLSGLQDESLALEAVRRGAQDYLVKAEINPRMLVRVIRYSIARARSEAALRESEDKFRKTFEEAPVGMLTVGPDGRYLKVNRAFCEMTGYSELELLQMTIEQLTYPEDYPQTKKFLEAFFAGKMKAAQFEKRYVRKDGEVIWVYINSTPFPPGRPPQYGLTIIENITERKKREERKDTFIGSVSHELRTPLTIISGGIRNLIEGIGGPLASKQRETLETVGRNADRLARLIDDLLDISRLESGKFQIHPKTVDTGSWIRETVKAFQYGSQDQMLLLDSEIPETLPPVYADPDMITQALTNLLHNALHFARHRVLVRVAVADIPGSPESTAAGGRDGGWVRVSIIDDGPGIAAACQPRLFSRFEQIGRPVGGSGYRGTGLGLAICKEIVEQNGGQIWVESRVGEGSQFHFTLPVKGRPR